MARISGVDLPRDKRVEIGLTYIYGIGRVSATKILAEAGVNPDTRCRDLTDDEVKEGICSRLSEEDSEIGCRVYDNWVQTMTPVKGMEKLVVDIHNSGKKLFLLSNISEGFAKTYPEVKWIKELFDNFDGIVLSGTIGKTKPNKDIFEYVLGKFGLNADECLFIDDSPKNISAAKAVGIDGYIFDDADKLREFLGF